MRTPCNRRRFLSAAAAGGAGLLILPNSLSARAYQANDKLDIALVGVGSRGRTHWLKAIPQMGENMAVLCDVNEKQLEGPSKQFPSARRFRDFRKMFDEMDRQIDAVVIATPVHSHAVIAAAAMQRGKHVYLEKPLTRTVGEARALREMARRCKVATQMGNQGMATDSFRRTLELIQDGAIGPVREAHVFYEAGGTGPLNRPQGQPVPGTLDWDLWIGPAPTRPFHPDYLLCQWPWTEKETGVLGWPNWRDFSGGFLSGAGAHAINLALKALDVQSLWDNAGDHHTIRVTTEISERCPENFPRYQFLHFNIPAHGTIPESQIHWHQAFESNAQRRAVRERLEKLAGRPLVNKGSWVPNSFVLVIGEKGMAFANFHNSKCTLLPEKRFPDAGGPPQKLPRSGSHEREWAAACKGGPRAISNFDYSGPAAEFLSLGNIASLVERPLEYDPIAMKIIGDDEADGLLNPPYRKGWTL